MTTQPKQLTYRETIEQELRALRRLRDKRLCCGPAYKDGACCAIGAFYAHAGSADSMDAVTVERVARSYGSSGRRFISDSRAASAIIYANEDFRLDDNSLKAQRARYAYMVQWCLDKLAEPQSVSA